MIVYIVMLIISAFLLLISNKIKNKWIKVFLEICSIIPLFLVSAFRYDIGTDYISRYVKGFSDVAGGFYDPSLEKSFILLIRFCLIFSQNPNSLFIVVSFIIEFLILGAALLKSKNKVLSLFIFVLGGFFFESMNLVRQYISVALIFFGSLFLIKDNWKYSIIYIILVLLAATFHRSAIFALILVLFSRKTLTNWKWVVPICGVIVLFHNIINTALIYILNYTSYNYYIDVSGKVSVLYILKNLIIYLFMQYIYYTNKKTNKIEIADKFFLNVQAINLIIICISACNFQFSRIAIYFSVFQILSIPYYISKINLVNVDNKLKEIFKNKIINVKSIASIMTVIFFTVFIFYTNVLHNDNEVIPYKTVLNKDICIYNYKIEQIQYEKK